ncbi:protein indeterminate-domain 12-like [Papaver somniferum]|uniref:protein indeterminate-domain 12-like n=1 Tax=Papaver somniferum TaxID=3469 RepID=UPI000E6F5CE7|nr:protein indeterminate-domain 12-like [Papaver somniferum]
MKGLILQQQQQQLLVEENMSSNLTNTTTSAASGEGILSSSLSPHNQSITSTTLTSSQTPSVKRKRSLPGNPDPDSEVIALSPKTLMATNRFVCEICNKGFQRDQNLQLHRRGHNLPWKLKQRNNKEVIKKKVYVCPEVNCVHHDPSRALGDLTGIKKHFSRKHGEKKWKCEKCSKKYAVQSDWKAHSKTCGTREYRCDCGTLFSRRDSFITHRAFCDALAEETARTPTISIINPLQQHQQLQPQYFHAQQQQQHYSLIRPEMPTWLSCPQPIELSTSSPSMYSTRFEQDQYSQQQTPSHETEQHQSKNYQQQISSPSAAASSAHMSATALLQKAALMGATISKPSSSSAATASLMNNRVLQPHHSHMSSSNGNNNPTSTTSVTTTETGFGLGLSSHEEDIENGSSDNNNNSNSFVPDHGLTSFDDDHNNSTKAAMTSGNFMDHHISAQTQQQLQDMMNSLSSASGGFDMSSSSFGHHHHQQGFDSTRRSSNESRASSTTTTTKTKTPKQNDGMTRDFLGLRAFSHADILNMNMNMNIGDGNKNFDHHLQQQCTSAVSPHHFDHHQQVQNQNTKSWQQ